MSSIVLAPDEYDGGLHEIVDGWKRQFACIEEECISQTQAMRDAAKAGVTQSNDVTPEPQENQEKQQTNPKRTT